MVSTPLQNISQNWIISPNRSENEKIFETTTQKMWLKILGARRLYTTGCKTSICLLDAEGKSYPKDNANGGLPWRKEKKHLEQTQVNYMCNLRIMTSTKGISIPNSKPPFFGGFKKSWVFPGKKKHILGEGYRVLKLMCFLLQNSIYNNWLSPPRHTDWSSPRSPTTAVPAEIPGKQNARKKQFRKRLGYFSRP